MSDKIAESAVHSNPRFPLLVSWGMAVLTVLVGATLYTMLPERVPVHFDLTGHPDRFADRSSFECLLLPLVSLALTTLLLGIARSIAWLADTHPAWINVPNKAKFLALSTKSRVAAMEPVRTALAWISVYVNLLFLYILIGTERVANGAWVKLPSWPVIIFLLLVFGTVIRLIIRANRTVSALSIEGAPT